MRTRLHRNRSNAPRGTEQCLTLTTEALPKALYRIAEAMVVLSLSRTVIYEEMRAGRLRFVERGSSRRITAAAVDEYVHLLEEEQAQREAA